MLPELSQLRLYIKKPMYGLTFPVLSISFFIQTLDIAWYCLYACQAQESLLFCLFNQPMEKVILVRKTYKKGWTSMGPIKQRFVWPVGKQQLT